MYTSSATIDDFIGISSCKIDVFDLWKCCEIRNAAKNDGISPQNKIDNNVINSRDVFSSTLVASYK